MALITEFRVRGYRAISEPVVLQGLTSYVPLYGDNAVGKSSLLQAVGLWGNLCAVNPRELLGNGRPWPEAAFFERFGQDVSMFNDHGDRLVEVSATTDKGLEIGFRLSNVNSEIAVAYAAIRILGRDLLSGIQAALSEQQAADDEAQRAAMAADASRTAPSPDESALVEMVANRAAEAASRLDGVLQPLAAALSDVSVSSGTSPTLPIPQTTRTQLFRALTSSDLSIRNRVRAPFKRLSTLFPALGGGDLEAITHLPTGAASIVENLGWIPESGPGAIMLDHLGGGVQSVVSTFASLLLSHAAVVCLEEPEAFVGALALDELRTTFHDASRAKICEQVWIATHAVTLVGAEDPIVKLERSRGVVRAIQGPALKLAAKYSIQLGTGVADPVGRLGVDGSVRIPKAMLQRAGLKTGDHVYFADTDGAIRVLTGEQLDATLVGKEDEA